MTLYRPAEDPKYQIGTPPTAEGLPEGTVVSEDTTRSDRIPPGQHRTRKWPILHAGQVPEIDPERWTLQLDGLVEHPQTWDLSLFRNEARARVFADFHCVTKWSRLGNLWEGVLLRPLLERAVVRPEAAFAVIHACDDSWTTNLPLEELLGPDVLLADTHDGIPLDADHGGPVRLVVPRLYAWKSAKWIRRIEITNGNHPGYWEQLGYHDLGEPWKEQRFRPGGRAGRGDDR